MQKKKKYEVVAAVIVNDGRVLCMRRGATRYEYTSYKWEFPGGKVEEGETPQEALRREIREEMSMEVEVGEHLTTVEHEYPDFCISMRCYVCRPVSPEFVMNEHAESRWMRVEEMSSLDWAAADRPAVVEARARML